MGTLSFLPWFTASEKIEFGPFRLIPIDLAKPSDAETQEALAEIKNILSNYKEVHKEPVDSATIMGLARKSIIEDLTDQEIDEVFRFREVVAFAGLSGRQYFSHIGYTNSEQYGVVVQRFIDVKSTPATSSRRRDGNTLAGYAPGMFEEIRPAHVPNTSMQLDITLIEALIHAYDEGGAAWSNFYDALLAYNAANTDNPKVGETLEVVLILGAFERLLGLRGGREDQLASRFVAELATIPTATEFKETRSLEKHLTQYPTLRESWIRDFFRVRNDLAHGKSEPAYPATWTLKEHLLLAAYIFPLVVKLLLAKGGFYVMRSDDLKSAFAIDHVLNIRSVFAKQDPNDPNSFSWNKVIRKAWWDYNNVEATQELKKLM